jgi:hypothetical protein
MTGYIITVKNPAPDYLAWTKRLALDAELYERAVSIGGLNMVERVWISDPIRAYDFEKNIVVSPLDRPLCNKRIEHDFECESPEAVNVLMAHGYHISMTKKVA